MKRIVLFVVCWIAVQSGVWAAVPTRTLPIVYVSTQNGQAISDRETQIPASVYIDSLGSVSQPVPCTIKGRGNWTWSGFDKKPYKIKLDTKQKITNASRSDVPSRW